jgi:hypothetical protein
MTMGSNGIGNGKVIGKNGKEILATLTKPKEKVELPGDKTYNLSIDGAAAGDFWDLNLAIKGDPSGYGFAGFRLQAPGKFAPTTVLSAWDKFYKVKDTKITVSVKKWVTSRPRSAHDEGPGRSRALRPSLAGT